MNTSTPTSPAAPRRVWSRRPSGSAGDATTIVSTSATFAGTTPISSELGYAADPPGAESGIGVADGRIATGLDRGQDRAGALTDTVVRHGAAPQESFRLGRDGRIGGRSGELQAAQRDPRGAHDTSFSMGRIRMPDAPAALRRGSNDQTWSASTTEWIAIIPS